MAHILCLAGLAIAVIAILLTVIFCLMGKKAFVPLGLFGLGVIIILGSGFLQTDGPTAVPTNIDDVDNVQLRVPESGSSGSIAVDQGLLDVDITIPAILFQSEAMSTFDGSVYAEQGGFSKAVLNDDGSVTITMSQNRHKELMDELSVQYNQLFSEMVGAEETPYIKSITSSNNFHDIEIEVDRDAYEKASLDLTPFVLGVSGMMYQSFDGSDLHVEIAVKDADTGETFHSVVYPDAWNAPVGE